MYSYQTEPACFNTERCVVVCNAVHSRLKEKDILSLTVILMRCFNTVTKSYLGMSRPTGQGLVELFQCDSVQAFFSGVSPKDLHPEKAIYQPSVLRKVHCRVITVQLTMHTLLHYSSRGDSNLDVHLSYWTMATMWSCVPCLAICRPI